MADAAMLSGPALLHRLRGLCTTGDVLHVGAHPDDEDGGLIAFVSHHYNSRIVYWSATRGESGQNRVGGYTGEELGVYRTWEALAARQIDGGEVLYGPFIDYGYSKNGEEALEKWGEEAVVREIVRAIRYVQPQIVVSRWRGDASDGHGQHAAVGIAMAQAFGAAGEPDRFPELTRLGLPPWEPRALYQLMTGDWQPGEHVTPGVERPEFESDEYLSLDTGTYDPISGLTYEEQAALAFNQYLTQATGSVPHPGSYFRYLREAVGHAMNGSRAAEDLADFDRTLTSLVEYPGGGSQPLRHELEAINELCGELVANFRLAAPDQSAPRLMQLVARFSAALEALPTFGLGAPAEASLRRYLERKLRHSQEVAARCAGLRLQATVDTVRVTPGEKVKLSCRLWTYGAERPRAVEFRPEPGLEGTMVMRLDDGSDPAAAEFEVVWPQDAPLTTPYWLREPHDPYCYVWPEEQQVSAPFDRPLLPVVATIEMGGGTLEIDLPAVRPEAFVGGSRELPISILPPISIQPEAHAHALRERDTEQVLGLRVEVVGYHETTPITGTLEIVTPKGWVADPPRIEIEIAQTGDADSFPVTVTVPPGTPADTYEIHYVVESFGRRYDAAVEAIRQIAPGLGGEPDEETCIREQFVARRSSVRVDVIETAVHEGLQYGYVAAPGGLVADILRSIGFSLRPLSDQELHEDYSAYDAIVIGPNAYLSRAELPKNAERLLHYVHGGGTLIVQYQGYLYADMAATPYPFRFHEPHDRVSRQSQPVKILAPDHFLLQFPNRIGERDFEGWVRDRGLYFFGEWDERYEPLLACSDPGEPDKLGGLLVASYGKGLFVYCAYSLFRQLAASVPGAFRLFANLLAAPEGRLRHAMRSLREMPLFASLDDQGLHELSRITDVRRLEDGEYLCRQGQVANELYILLDGSLEVLEGDPEQFVRAYEHGAVVGELLALTGLKHQGSVRARESSHVYVFDSEAFRAFLLGHAQVSERLLEQVAQRLVREEVS